jgi:hypothetical protein
LKYKIPLSIGDKLTPLGKSQFRFLSLISQCPLSASEIYPIIKKQIDIKNVRKILHRLLSLGLIEIEDHYPRNKIKYRLTSRGLFRLFCRGSYYMRMSALELYKEDVILQVILYRYFEIETIKEFEEVAFGLLGAYISKCCDYIQKAFEDYTDWQEQEKLKQSPYLYDRELLAYDIDQALKREIKNFVFQIITLSDSPGLKSQGYPPGIFPIRTLNNDGKFMEIFHNITSEFSKGCKNFN